jgi:hypothetical protein
MLEQTYASQGFFDFKSRTAQVLSSSAVSADSNSLMLFLFIQVWEFAPSGQSYARTLSGHILLNVHANSARMISSSSIAITPETCSIDKSYPPQHRQSSVTSRRHAPIFPASLLCSFFFFLGFYLSFHASIHICLHLIPLHRYDTLVSALYWYFIKYFVHSNEDPHCAGFPPPELACLHRKIAILRHEI